MTVDNLKVCVRDIGNPFVEFGNLMGIRTGHERRVTNDELY